MQHMHATHEMQHMDVCMHAHLRDLLALEEQINQHLSDLDLFVVQVSVQVSICMLWPWRGLGLA